MTEHATPLPEQVLVHWRRLDMPGYESAELVHRASGARLSGIVLLVWEGMPSRLTYDIRCDASWRTERVRVRGHVGIHEVSLELDRRDDDTWHRGTVHCRELDGCIDVDLGFTPSTNVLPIRRLRLEPGGRADVRAAWVRFPGLVPEVLDQSYERLDRIRYRYASAGGTFERELTVSPQGIVLEYPGLWHAEAVAVP